MTKLHGTSGSGEAEPTGTPRKDIVHRANLGRWTVLGALLSNGAGAAAFVLMVRAGGTTADALMAAGGAAATTASLYVTVSAFINGLREP